MSFRAGNTDPPLLFYTYILANCYRQHNSELRITNCEFHSVYTSCFKPHILLRVIYVRRPKIIILFLVLFLIVAGTVVFIEFRLKNVRDEMSEFTARNAAAGSILAGVEETVHNANYYYDDLVTIVRDEEGNIKSLVTNTSRLNTVSNAVNRNVDSRINHIETYPVSIPFTSIIGSELVSGIGPDITFHVTLTGTASTSFDNVFDSAGVNQTRHQIMLKVTVKTYVIFGASVTKHTVSTDVCIAENIIVGITPEAIAQITK